MEIINTKFKTIVLKNLEKSETTPFATVSSIWIEDPDSWVLEELEARTLLV